MLTSCEALRQKSKSKHKIKILQKTTSKRALDHFKQKQHHQAIKNSSRYKGKAQITKQQKQESEAYEDTVRRDVRRVEGVF
jgi:hypothetical protein